MSMIVINTQAQDPEVRCNGRESDGRFALKLNSKRSVKRCLRRDEEREARRLELEELYGEDACMYA